MGRASVRPVPRSRRKGLDGRASRREELCLDVIDPLLATSPDRGRDLPDRARRSRRTSRRESHSGLAAPAAALPAVGSPFLGSGLRGAHGVQSGSIELSHTVGHAQIDASELHPAPMCLWMRQF